MATAVFFHAHPDDESIATGGTIARLADEGHRVVVVTATGGELGEVPDGLLAQGETLAQRRASEVEAACNVLGASRHVFLGYRDSGMADEPTNNDPESFWKADLEEAAQRLADILRKEEAEVLTIYDENGGYGHPDHIQVHRVGTRAAQLAETPRLYMATMNRTYLKSLAELAHVMDVTMTEEERERIDYLGVEESRITTEIDVSAYLPLKRKAMEVHASQISETSFFLSMPADAFSLVWGKEWFIKMTPPVPKGRESSLL